MALIVISITLILLSKKTLSLADRLFVKKEPDVLTKFTVYLIVILLLIPLIINESYKIGGYVTMWGAGDVLSFYGSFLSFIGTVVLGALALQSSLIANRISKQNYEFLERQSRYADINIKLSQLHDEITLFSSEALRIVAMSSIDEYIINNDNDNLMQTIAKLDTDLFALSSLKMPQLRMKLRYIVSYNLYHNDEYVKTNLELIKNHINNLDNQIIDYRKKIVDVYNEIKKNEVSQFDNIPFKISYSYRPMHKLMEYFHNKLYDIDKK